MRIRKLKDFCAHLKNIGEKAQKIAKNRLNNGGCGVYAFLMVDALIKCDIPAFGIVATYDGRDLDAQRPQNSRDVSEWRRNGVGFNHIGFLVPSSRGLYAFDSDFSMRYNPGETLNSWPIIKGRLTRDELHGLIQNPYDWNCSFDRGCIPKLEKLVELEMSKQKISQFL